jgi:hypothetical protein
MKNLIVYSLLLIFFGLFACDDFLDVNPRETIKSDVLFTTQNGYRTALNGVYLMMADQSLYGKNTSMYLPELLVRHWAIPSDNLTSDRYIVPNYDFSNLKGNTLLSGVWTSYYKAIAQLNDILAALATPSVQFTGHTRELLEGEARGLRALLHLEVLRFWGPVPGTAISNTPAIPYVTELTKDPAKLVAASWSTVIENIKTDLNRAEELLAEADPIRTYGAQSLNPISDNTASIDALPDIWFYYRQNRFNYYAALATKARFYNWLTSNSTYGADAKNQAIHYARQVIEATGPNGNQFNLINRLSLPDNGLILFGECIFALDNPKLQTMIMPLFINNNPELTQVSGMLDVAYEAATHSQDMRYGSISDGRYWQTSIYNGVAYNHFAKYSDARDTPYGKTTTYNQIPLLRLSEMYFILIENVPLNEANTVFKTFREARSMNSIIDNSLTDEQLRVQRLEKEYRKEFYGEGQMFFFYKRHQYLSFPYPDAFILPNGLDNYVLPLPKDQQNFE